MTFEINRTVGWMILLGFVCLTGCQTADQAHTGHMASVEISGHTPAEIKKATTTAFIENGFYKVDDLIFEKKGSTWESVNYGGWSSDLVWIKVRAELNTVESTKYTLSCDAFAVEAHGEGIMQIERKFKFAKRSELKKILDEVKAALN